MSESKKPRGRERPGYVGEPEPDVDPIDVLQAHEEEIGHIHRDMETLQADIAKLLGRGPPEKASSPGTLHVWGCKKCGWKLGYYDHADDVLMIKTREALLHFHPGPGGWVRMICPKCSAMAIAEDEPKKSSPG
jgi:hypothetical protein